MYERILDRSSEPTREEMAKYCQDRGESFISLNEWLTTEYGSWQTVAFPYGKSYGWCVGHRRGSALICNVFPEAGAYSVMIRLCDADIAAVYRSVSEYTRGVIDNKYPCSDGGWIHYRVLNDDDERDIRIILTRKCTTPYKVK